MTDGNTPCLRPTDTSHQLDATQRQQSSRADFSADALLLAAQDADAEAALAKALGAAEIAFEPLGPALALRGVGPAAAEVHARLQRVLPEGLQARVRGVFAAPDAAALFAAFVQAEPLTTLFDRLEVDWARQAIEQRCLFSVYHPIIEARTRSLFAHEALIRATHPTTGETVGAASLIYACERLNLEHALDQQARIAAFEGCRDGDRGTGPAAGRLFVNLRPSAVYDPEVCLRSTFEAAAANGVPLDRVVFEVVGTERLASLARLRELVAYLRAQGAGVALDDISSGFTSLEHVAELKPDYAKVDRLLVESAVFSVSSRHTLDSIVRLAGRLGVRVIAEGVETVEQMEVCVEAGVDYLQGYLFAHPAAPPQVWPATRPAQLSHAA